MTPAFTDRRLHSAELLQHGQRALREGRRVDARRCFQEAVAANPLEGRAWLELARLSSPVARAFYLVEAFDLNPTSRSILEELRHAYRDVIHLTTGTAPAAQQPVDRADVVETRSVSEDISRLGQLSTESVSEDAGSSGFSRPKTAEAVTTNVSFQTLLQLIHQHADSVWEELRRAYHHVKPVVVTVTRQLVRRVQKELSLSFPRSSTAAEARPLRLYTVPGVGLWLIAAVLGVSLLTTLSAASGWQRPAPAAVALGSRRKVTFTPTASATPTATATATPLPTVLTATPIPSATPTNTPEPLLRWVPELEANGWTFERGVCEGPFIGPVGTERFIWPAGNHYLSGHNFSWRYHPGIDIATQPGDPIYASDTGVVVFAGWNSQGYGNLVVLDHGNGWQTLYAHLSQINVDCGQAAYQGSVIGSAGSTGHSTGPHLHFEILSDAYGRVNPWSYLP
jgi:murein DD-endopeptidase MepM/ murein hydrolase activator NlpD